jgi:citrate lyase subunit beta/citryl-CoA lyase
VNSRAVLDARAAGLVQIFGGGAGDIHNLELLRSTALRARQFGCGGSVVLHPSQVPIVNEIFSPTIEQLDVALGILSAMQEAVAANSAATLYKGRMVDIAHAQSALELLNEARAFGMDVEIPIFWAAGVTGTVQ